MSNMAPSLPQLEKPPRTAKPRAPRPPHVKPVIPKGLPAPAAKLLRLGARVVHYRCFCGQKASCSTQDWAAGIDTCHCTWGPVPYPRQDMTGVRFNRLTVVAWAGKRQHAPLHHDWKCRCDCGTEKVISFAALSSGATRSCGCLSDEERRSRKGLLVDNLVGQRFGMLVVVRQAAAIPGHISRNARWECQCDCGAVTSAAGSVLKDGKVKSCGCLRQQGMNLAGLTFKQWTALAPLPERVKNNGSVIWACECRCGKQEAISYDQLRTAPPKCACTTWPRVKAGMRFGLLTAVEKAPKAREKAEVRWKCRCDCGNEREVAARSLFINSYVYSCGCAAQWIPHVFLPSARTATHV